MADFALGEQRASADQSTVSSASPFVVQSSSTRPRVDVGNSSTLTTSNDVEDTLPSFLDPGQLAGTTSNFELNQHPLSKPAFVNGLKWAGYLEPLDTSRNKIKQRFNHFLEKENASLLFPCCLLSALSVSMERSANETSHSSWIVQVEPSRIPRECGSREAGRIDGSLRRDRR
jgi:hypothetical protein